MIDEERVVSLIFILLEVKKMFSTPCSLLHTQAKMRQAGAGLGSRGSSYGVYSSSGSYKETLKNLTKARYDEMFTD